MPQPSTVAIVVDPDFGERLHELAERFPCWIADTPPNRDAAQSHWNRHPGQSHIDGVTTFRVAPNEDPADWLLSVLPDVLEHHGPYSKDPPVEVLEVVGVAPTARLAASLGDYGVVQVIETAAGLRATLA